MNKKTLKFNNIEVSKKEFHVSKQPVAFDSVLINRTVVFHKFEQSGKSFKYFIIYKEDDIIRPLCITLP